MSGSEAIEQEVERVLPTAISSADRSGRSTPQPSSPDARRVELKGGLDRPTIAVALLRDLLGPVWIERVVEPGPALFVIGTPTFDRVDPI
ncbi:hypothetical protein [Rhizobium leguminosarum]|uniref:Uncharacterized protein n=1 Tax=Rhizobium leguminosarum TaxID=384 RepID=A0A1B1C445_RHILE|nr:hypothetical protein [Rhizobium leguminosarum]ANP84500.1 hypothetical protein BA011_01265 [Rhizobium leguminosarum]